MKYFGKDRDFLRFERIIRLLLKNKEGRGTSLNPSEHCFSKGRALLKENEYELKHRLTQIPTDDRAALYSLFNNLRSIESTTHVSDESIFVIFIRLSPQRQDKYLSQTSKLVLLFIPYF